MDKARPSTRRPAFVTWLAAAVFLLSAANFASLAVGLVRWPVFESLRLSLPLWAIMLSGGLWGIIWLAISWGLWRLAPWARRAALVLFVAYQVTLIGQQILFARGAYERERLPFASGVAILLIALVAFGLTRPRIRQAFEGPLEEPELNDIRPED